jgi:Bifunctional DNA primase/polymerase, N-terminal
MDPADAALDAACRGWHVFPLRPGAKTPATKNGFHDATDDPERIWAWWQRHPTSNIGIATGASRLLVVDLDPAEDNDGHCAQAFTALCQLATDHDGDLPHTYEVTTPRGGEHWYYHVAEGVDMPRNSASKLGPHIDIRSDGGYVVGAGSQLDSGGRYNVAEDIDVHEAPGWLVETCQRPAPTPPIPTAHARNWDDDSPAARRLIGACGRVALAPKGKRNDMLYWAAVIAGEIVSDRAMHVVDIVRQLELAGQRAGLEQREIEATINSGMRHTAGGPA